jgi:hypothetical protein
MDIAIIGNHGGYSIDTALCGMSAWLILKIIGDKCSGCSPNRGQRTCT